MLSRGRRFHVLRLYRSIWFLPTACAIGSVVVLAVAPILDQFVPYHLLFLFEREALEEILSILATSMLAVAIFSLGTMVSALEASASAATPRARVLITQDRTAQRAISTFIGAFIFSILGIIGLSTGYYGDGGTACIFMIAILIIVAVIVMLISWIRRLSQIGGVREVVRLVEQATAAAFAGLAKNPLYGGRNATDVPSDLHPVSLDRHGYIQHIEGEALGELSEALNADLYLVARPGYLVGPGVPILYSNVEMEGERLDRITQCFVTGNERTFEEDPQFGILALSEIASKALSPAVNDPGTAIDVINAVVRIIRDCTPYFNGGEAEVRFPRLHVKPLQVETVVADGFRWIARDGAGYLEVATKIQRALADIRSVDPAMFGDCVADMSREAFERANSAMTLDRDIETLRRQRAELGFPDDPAPRPEATA